MPDAALLTAAEAAALLGVAPATLYAYVSRGAVRSEPGPDGKRRLYRREDLEALRRRKGRAPDGAAQALDFGMPVLPSAISQIADGVLRYRGRDATALADAATSVDVAALLWQTPVAALRPVGLPRRLPRVDLAEPLPRAIAVLAHGDEPAAGTRSHRAAQAARLWAVLGAALLDRPPAATPVIDQVAAAWNLDAPRRRAVEAALILLADHELNASTFAVRVAASTGASLALAVVAGLATLSGPRHGGESDRAAALLDEIGAPDKAAAAVRARLRRGERLPGFGHPLYPAGDPRGRHLLALTAADPLARAAAAAVAAQTGEPPNVDFGLVAMARALGLPAGAPLALFALGRCVGWLAHALEQQDGGMLIRPRTRYVGPGPIDQ